MKYLGAKGDEKNTSYQVYGSVRVIKEIKQIHLPIQKERWNTWCLHIIDSGNLECCQSVISVRHQDYNGILAVALATILISSSESRAQLKVVPLLTLYTS